MSWFTYDTVIGGAERQRWYTAQGPVVTGQPNAALTIYQNTGGNFNAPPVTNAQAVGTATLSFSILRQRSADVQLHRRHEPHRGDTVDAADAECDLLDVRPPYPTNADFALSGNWFGGAATSGQGFTAEVNPISARSLRPGTRTCRTAPPPERPDNVGTRRKASFTPGMRSIPVTIYETTGGMFDTPTPPGQKTVVVGTRDDDLPELLGRDVRLQLHRRHQHWPVGTITLSRVGPVPPGCTS